MDSIYCVMEGRQGEVLVWDAIRPDTLAPSYVHRYSSLATRQADVVAEAAQWRLRGGRELPVLN